MLELALKEGRVHLPPIVVAELMSGQMRSAQRLKLKQFVRELEFCNCDLDHWERVAALREHLAHNGMAVSTPDTHVAQCCLDLKALDNRVDLLTQDQIFTKIAKFCDLTLV